MTAVTPPPGRATAALGPGEITDTTARRRPGTHPAARRAETHRGRVRRARRINRTLAVAYPEAYCELDFRNPYELIVATILSAQCTDARVNAVTPALFATYPDATALAGAHPAQVEELIRPTGFFRAKASHLLGMAAAVVERFDGEIPHRLDDLVTLPGVGRKTANVVLGNVFATPGLTVDTHLGRLARRWGLSTSEDPLVVERDLADLIERKYWTDFSHRAIVHGRRVCHSRTPACGACFLAYDCPSYGEDGPTDPEIAATKVRGPERPVLLQLAGLEETA